MQLESLAFTIILEKVYTQFFLKFLAAKIVTLNGRIIKVFKH